jgi:3-hydroxyisobutyrate dehydrogenase
MAAPPLRLGWIGLGKMGRPMAQRLLQAGYHLAVFNRTADKARPLAEAGASVAASPAAVARQADIVFTMLADDGALEAVALGPEGALAGAGPAAVLIDMSTVSPGASRRVADAAQQAGAAYLRAPVSGSTQFAEAGRLTILVSGPRPAFDACTPLLERLGQTLYYLGAGEEARAMKLVINMLVATTAAMVGEALTLGEKNGLDWAQMIEILQHSAVGSPLIGYKAKSLTEKRFVPAFTAAQIAKDCDLAMGLGRESLVPLPVTALVRQLYNGMLASGRGSADFFSILFLLEEMAGLRRRE